MNTENTPKEEAPVKTQAPVEPVKEAVSDAASTVEEVKAEVKAEVKVARPAVIEDRSAVVSGADKDDVLLTSCVYKNSRARKSLSVHHLQRRLAVLGYSQAYGDKDGWYGDQTKSAVAAFQSSCGIEATGFVDAVTLHAIFDGDTNVIVIA